MVLDFDELSQVVNTSAIERLDHQDLNAVTGLHTIAEHLAHWIWEELTADPYLKTGHGEHAIM